MTTEATWKPHEKHGHLTEESDLPDTVFAFPKQRKEPLTDAAHVRDAVATAHRRAGQQCPRAQRHRWDRWLSHPWHRTLKT